MKRRLAQLATAVLLLCAATVQAEDPYFLDIGSLSGYPHTWGYGLSQDGTTVVGEGQDTTVGATRPWHWTATNGYPWPLPSPGAGFTTWRPTAVFKELGYPRTVVGTRFTPTTTEACICGVVSTNVTGLGDLPGGAVCSEALAVQGYEGATVAGYGTTASGIQAVRWVLSNTENAFSLEPLGFLPGGSTARSCATGISRDQRTIVGWSSSANAGTETEAFRWTTAEGMRGLGDLPGGVFQSTASAISADGQTIVGMSQTDLGGEAFRWTEAEGMVCLGHMPAGHVYSRANGVSADGSVIVGEGTTSDEFGIGAFIWDRAHGLRPLSEVLTELGMNVQGWELSAALAVSADGRVIMGTGFSPDRGNMLSTWVAYLGSGYQTPEPSSLLLCMGAATLLGRRSRRVRRL